MSSFSNILHIYCILIGTYPTQHQQLITQVRVAKTMESGNLDKSHGNITFDLFDTFRLSVIRYIQDGIEVIRKK